MINSEIIDKINNGRLIALWTPDNSDDIINIYEILNKYGIVPEIAFRSEYALKAIKQITDYDPDAVIFAGTIINKNQASDAIEAGVRGIVSPDIFPDVISYCCEKDIICIPGGINNTGYQLSLKAKYLNCDFEELKSKYFYQWIHKIFPAVTESNNFYELSKALRGPYKNLNILYTGGININNVNSIIDFDKNAIVCASALTKNKHTLTELENDILEWNEIIKDEDHVRPEKQSVLIDRNKIKVVTFGEIMMRLSPPGKERIIQANSFDITFGGAEANTAVAFANYGLYSKFITALPDNEIGNAAMNSLRKYGVDTSDILRVGERTGIYFLEHGASQRPSKVIYDRKNSSIATIKAYDFNWENIFEEADHFHWSGITPALGKSTLTVLKKALSTAVNNNIQVSVDLNYRKNLWDRDRAGKTMTELMKYVNICIGNEEDAEMFFNIKADRSDIENGTIDPSAYEYVSKELYNKYDLNYVAITLRKSISASKNFWSACLFNGKDFMISKEYNVIIVDRVGAGDSFSSGLIYGLLTGMSDKDSLEFAVAASCLKQTIHGDINLVSVGEVLKLASGNTSGRILR